MKNENLKKLSRRELLEILKKIGMLECYPSLAKENKSYLIRTITENL